MTPNKSVSIALLIVLGAFAPYAQDIDENDLFGTSEINMVDSATLASGSSSLAGTDSTSTSFSGSVSAITEPGVSRDWFSTRDRNDISLSALMLGDINLDVRLPLGMKAYADAETYYRPETGAATFTVPELFLDANFKHKVYFRAGKQVLQWGRGYFWNPTDLVNVEKKSFIEKIGAREGTFGVKTHIPFGTKWNIYGFLDMNNTSSVDSLAGAARFEGLFGGTEAGVALWGKQGKDPIFGLDFSTTILNWSFTGEMSLTSGSNYHILNLEKSFDLSSNSFLSGSTPRLVFTSPNEDAVVRLCLGIMRSFDFLDIDDRLMVVGEFYFNQVGDNGNIFQKYHLGEHFSSISSLPDTSSMKQTAGAVIQNAFEFNSLARYYSAFFVTMSKFIVSDMSLQLNALVNYNHHCAILTAGVQYATMHNFSLGCLATGYVGPREAEYTFMGSGASIRLTAGVRF